MRKAGLKNLKCRVESSGVSRWGESPECRPVSGEIKSPRPALGQPPRHCSIVIASLGFYREKCIAGVTHAKPFASPSLETNPVLAIIDRHQNGGHSGSAIRLNWKARWES